jgi:hypothetical protein
MTPNDRAEGKGQRSEVEGKGKRPGERKKVYRFEPCDLPPLPWPLPLFLYL